MMSACLIIRLLYVDLVFESVMPVFTSHHVALMHFALCHKDDDGNNPDDNSDNYVPIYHRFERMHQVAH